MPELPEVETLRGDLARQGRVVGRRIVGATLLDPQAIFGVAPADFERRLVGRRFVGLERKGKYLAALRNQFEGHAVRNVE